MSGLGGDDCAEQQVVGSHDVRTEDVDGFSSVGGELLGGAGNEAVAHPAEHHERVSGLPIAEQVLVAVECRGGGGHGTTE